MLYLRSNIKKAKETLVSVAQQHPNVLEDPAPYVVVLEFGKDAIHLELRFYVDFGRGIETKEDLNMSIEDSACTLTCPFYRPHPDIPCSKSNSWSFELIPSVWLFAENDDFMGQILENDPLWSLEAHLTRDFATHFFGSLDLLYQSGFQSKIDGSEVGDKLEIGNLGFTFNYQISDNIILRTCFSSNVFGDKDLETSVLRLQFVFAWNPATERMKKLSQRH